MRKRKGAFHITLVFSALVFMILTLTMMLTGLLTAILLKEGVIGIGRPKVSLVIAVFAFVSVILGTVLSHMVGRQTLQVIRDIDTATREVVKGNFDVRLKENIPVEELQSMACNFNTMIRELSGTEIFRTDFIENVSHEFKTPLSAIEGYVTLLQQTSLPEEKHREYTERIMRNTKRLSSLTGNILQLSRLENQELEIRKETFSLDEQLREVILLFESDWTEKKIDLDIDLCTVDYTGNKEMLMQVWQNIFANAMKFVKENGQIRVLLHENEERVEVSIADDGIGMEEEVLKRIYEKFYQADDSRSSAGNGLGLTLAKRIVDLHKGEIHVSSKPGKGTSFTVCLPRGGECRERTDR